jgi:hypothetical protein
MSSEQTDNLHLAIDNSKRRAEMVKFVDNIKRTAQIIHNKKTELESELTHSHNFYEKQQQIIEYYYSTLITSLEEHRNKTLETLSLSKASTEHSTIQLSQLFDQ